MTESGRPEARRTIPEGRREVDYRIHLVLARRRPARGRLVRLVREQGHAGRERKAYSNGLLIAAAIYPCFALLALDAAGLDAAWLGVEMLGIVAYGIFVWRPHGCAPDRRTGG